MFTWKKLLVRILGLSALLVFPGMAGTIVSPAPNDKPALHDSVGSSTLTAESGISNAAGNLPVNPPETKHSNGILLLLLIVIPVWILLNAITSPEFYDYMRSIYFPEEY